MHPPRPAALALSGTVGRGLRVEWTPAAKKKVRPFLGEGKKPRPPSTDKLNQMFSAAVAHHERRCELFPDLELQDPSGIQECVLRSWRAPASALGDRPVEECAAHFLMTARAIKEANQGNARALTNALLLLTDELAAGLGIADAIEVLARVWELELEDEKRSAASEPTPWWFPGWAFPPTAVSVDVWFRMREWLARADDEDRQAALSRVRAHNDMEFTCAAALAFPNEAIWRPHVGEVLTRIEGAGQRPHAQQVRVTSLAACPITVSDALELFSTRPEIANTYEYPTLVHALGTEGFDLVASLQPTAPKAAESRFLALSVFVGAEAVEVFRRAHAPNKRAQKLIEQYLDRNA